MVHVPPGYVSDGDYYAPRHDYDEWYEKHMNIDKLRFDFQPTRNTRSRRILNFGVAQRFLMPIFLTDFVRKHCLK